MSFREFVAKELDAIKEALHLDPLEPRTWQCSPLLVVAEDDSVTYYGPANVEVTPNAEGTALLVTDVEIDGLRLSMQSAKVEFYVGRVGRGQGPGTGDGLICRGKDGDGVAYTWYVSGAALAYGANLVRGVHCGAAMPARTKRFHEDSIG